NVMFPTNQTLNSNRNRVALILSALCCTAVVASLTDSVRPVSAQSAGPSWSYTGRLNEPRVAPVATQLQDGRVLIAGGFGMDDDITKSVELYNPNTGAWSPTGNLVSADGGINLTVLTDGKVLAVGYSGTELYDPSA